MPTSRTSRRSSTSSSTSAGRTTASRSTSRSTARRSTTTSRARTTSQSTGTGSSARQSSSTGSSSIWGGTRSTARKTSGSSTSTSRSSSASYTPIKRQFEQKIQSFQQLKSQTEGPAKAGRPSPSVLNRWANLVNNGAVVFEVPGTRIAKFTKAAKPFTTAGAACRALQSTFGKSTIKDVIQSKNGRWLVATAATRSNGQPFRFPTS